MGIKQKIMHNEKLFPVISETVDKLNKFLGKNFPVYFSKQKYKKVFGRELDLDNPQTLNEKLMYCKLNTYWDKPIVSRCADKYEVREFIKENNCEELLNPILGAWDDAKDIDWDSLPEKFAIKCNHGSGYNLICTDKKKFDTEKATETLNNWMHEKYGYRNAEQGIYSLIKRKIIAEKFIDTDDGTPPKDYKFFCSYGKVLFLFVASDRYDGNTKFDYYYPDWTWIPVTNAHPNKGCIEKPENLEKMIEYAEKLSKKFPLVRVDFYDADGKVIFGEITFTHFGCVHRFDPDEYDYEFGKMFPSGENLKEIK